MTTTFDYGEPRSADIRVDANTEGCLGGDPGRRIIAIRSSHFWMCALRVGFAGGDSATPARSW